MGRLRQSWVKWALVATGLLATSCAGVVGAGAAVVVVGAGILSFTCYDRVSVTVTDGLTGTSLCDAKVTFIKGTSTTEATSCYQAALTTGKYRLRVERHGLVPYEEPFEVTESDKCGQSVQTMYVALDRVNRAPAPPIAAPQVVLPPQNGTLPQPAAAPATTPTQSPGAAPSTLPSPPPPTPAPPPSPPGSAPAPTTSPAPAPSSTAFPNAP